MSITRTKEKRTACNVHWRSRRRWITGAASPVGCRCAAALAALVPLGVPGVAASANSAGPSTLRIGYQLVPNGDLVVKDKRWLEKSLPGTKMQWIKFDSGGDVNTAIVAGAIDIGLAGSSPVTKGLAPPLNIPYMVPWIFDVIGTNEALVVKKSEGISSVPGLAGKTIATPFASTSHYSLLAALAGAGVPASKVKIVDLEPQDIVAAWARGDIDGAYVWTPFLAELRKSGTTLISSAQLAKKGKTTADLAVVRTAFAQKYPNVVRTWVQQEDRAVKLYRSNPKRSGRVDRPATQSLTAGGASSGEGARVAGRVAAGDSEVSRQPGKAGGLAKNLFSAAQFLKSQDKIDSVPPLSTFQKGIANAYVAQVAGA